MRIVIHAPAVKRSVDMYGFLQLARPAHQSKAPPTPDRDNLSHHRGDSEALSALSIFDRYNLSADVGAFEFSSGSALLGYIHSHLEKKATAMTLTFARFKALVFTGWGATIVLAGIGLAASQ